MDLGAGVGKRLGRELSELRAGTGGGGGGGEEVGRVPYGGRGRGGVVEIRRVEISGFPFWRRMFFSNQQPSSFSHPRTEAGPLLKRPRRRC